MVLAWLLGLTAVGPTAGGWVASMQAAGWVTAGGTLATLQSSAMTGGALIHGIPVVITGLVAAVFAL